LVLVSYGKGFRSQIKTARIKFLESRFPQGNPFTELGIDVKKAKTWLAVQIEVTAKLDVFGMIFLPLRALRNIARAKTRFLGNDHRSLSIASRRKWSRPDATLPKQQSDERA